MSSIVGHALAGIVAGRSIAGGARPQQSRNFYALVALASLLPDLDVIVFILFSPSNMTPHRGASHSLLFAAISALLLAFLCARFFSLSKIRLFACIFAAYFSHLVLDYLMGCGPKVPFFWPLIDRGFLSPIQLVPTAHYGLSANAFRDMLLSPSVYFGFALELAIFLPLIYLPNAKALRQRADLLAVSASGVAATLALY